MVGGQQGQEIQKKQENINPEKQMDNEGPKPQAHEEVVNLGRFDSFFDIDKEVQEVVNVSGSNIQLEGEHEQNPINVWQEESRPSPPIEESGSQSMSNPKDVKVKHANLANELLKLTKKTTGASKEKERKERQRKVRCYITNFEPYLPTFLDEMHKNHFKSIIRIGERYQAHVPSQPEFEQRRRPLKHLLVWKGSEQKVSKEALKKFRQIYGDNRNEEELILLKNRLQSENWNDLIREMDASKLPGKRSNLVIASNSLGMIATRNK